MAFMRFGGFMRCSMRNVLNPKRIRSGFKTKPLEAISMKQSRKVERMSMRLWGATQRDTPFTSFSKCNCLLLKKTFLTFLGFSNQRFCEMCICKLLIRQLCAGKKICLPMGRDWAWGIPSKHTRCSTTTRNN